MGRPLAVVLAAWMFLQPALALSATDPPLCGSANAPPGCEPYQTFRTTSRYQRVAIIKPSRWDVITASNQEAIKKNIVFNLGNLVDEMKLRGLEVHQYTTDFFEKDQAYATTNAQDKREMWSNLGEKYALAIVLSPNASVAGFARYVCADSTNTQVVVFGGGGASWSGADTTVRGFMDSSDHTFRGTSSQRGSCQVTTDGVDTLWGITMAAGRRKATLGTGIDGVFRTIVPQTTSGVHWLNTSETALIDGGSADSTTTNMPTSYTDTTAASAGILGSIWRVKFTNNMLAAVPTALNGVSDGGPTSVYWVKCPDGAATGRAIPHYLWSLVCRFTTARPIPFGFDWDDVVDQTATSRDLGGRWRPTAADTCIALLQGYGVKPTTMVNPGHMKAYLDGTTPYNFKSGASIDVSDSSTRRESYWISPTGSNYLRNLTWVHHSHDSTTESIASGLVGGYGGYATGNHYAWQGAGETGAQLWSYRLASTWQPSGGRTTGKWGIVQRLLWSDSLRKSIAPSMSLPPYMAFPANQMLPKNWKVRTLINAWNTKQSLSASCPPDSVFWAYHTGLGLKTKEKLYVRFISDDPHGQLISGGFITETGGIHYQWDRDSVVASTVFLYPNERLVVPPAADGRSTKTVGVHSFLQGAGGRSTNMDNANGRLAKLMGLKNPIRFMSVSDPTQGYTGAGYVGDAMAVMTAGSEGVQDWNGRQATRVVYIHPGQLPAIQSPAGNYDVDVCVMSYFAPMRALDKIAGRKCTVNVPAWQVYNK